MKWENAEFNVDSPTEVIALYSDRLFGSKDWEKLDIDSFQILFVHILSDYYDEGLSLDVLSMIASMINDLIVNKSGDGFSDILNITDELNYLLRRTGDSGNDGTQLVKNLIDLKKYYFENKNKIK